ncbi:FAD-dependent monooxygenase [Amycolatopsis sp. 195334CR]|uniref:FAD-dependent monooxygenase n=1 Tax=Amycolatopsis sp. 195334CR TaxID=2814588 RepID=UPI001A8D706A|nr:FAD-dependent monooxygenase [Amycolatopsis sp. 195334CR]MBN6038533.1 FAD-dependent monooxygenase [Amycolatopsis sp. 195334CR]
MKTVICGAGIAGLTLAARLSDLGGDVVLLERAPSPRTHGYMIDFFGPGYDAARSIGLLPALEDIAHPITEAWFVDARGRRRATVRPTLFAHGPLLSLMRPDLERVLRDQLLDTADQRFGVSPVAVAERGDRVLVTLDNGTELEADLLVGADGIHSAIRRLVFGDESQFFRYLGFHTAAYTFDSPAISTAVAGRACLTDTIDSQMGFYALPAGRVATFGIHRTPDPTLPDDVRAAVLDAYADLGWLVPDALDRCPPSAELYYDQVAQIEMPRWSNGNVVLVGDACHAVSLLAGQGASLGVAGAYLLADQLARRPISQAVLEYERLWRPVAEEKQKTGRAAARWFLPGSAWQLPLRRAALRTTHVPVLNRLIAASVAGKPTPLIRNLPAANKK